MPKKNVTDNNSDEINDLMGIDIDDIDITDIDVSMENNADDPFKDIKYKNNVTVDPKLEVSALLSAFKSRAVQESKRMQQAIDSEFWFAVCFKTREEKEEFLKKYKLINIGDKYLPADKFIKAIERKGGD